ncbi:hypothetical protein [Novosphingobium beihaiensis]|uniref:Uncharacterized protein n=1 Tax=Novosphingobium beihaiensis TaxID=2930389 RepID=A0ABT0BKF8_9SPHN|nr:hypothetical protein [Novosphingobium beihaiensis]MCJ2185445.1 hypothetical protein [Novosphingobium beihaiensis]
MVTLIDRVQHKMREARHRRVARGILDTPPARPRDDGVVIFSMIGTRVLLPYLVAAKSLHARLDRGRFAILDDGTLTAADKAVLDAHLGKPQIYAIGDVDPGDCPRGGCWERLLTLLALRRENYVIQLDSDTVTAGPVDEVIEAVAAGRNFTLCGGIDSALLPVEDYAGDLAALDPSAHVQLLAETSLDRIGAGLPHPRRYVRGCAGFAGFAPGGFDRTVADAYSREASALLGRDRWQEWGTEQVMSNVIISAENEPVLLPYARYMNFWNEAPPPGVNFVHFVGTYRFHGGYYDAATRQAIAALKG